MGELSAELETSKGGANPAATLPSTGKSKTEALKDAGISTSAANRFEPGRHNFSCFLLKNSHFLLKNAQNRAFYPRFP